MLYIWKVEEAGMLGTQGSSWGGPWKNIKERIFNYCFACADGGVCSRSGRANSLRWKTVGWCEFGQTVFLDVLEEEFLMSH